MLFVALTAAFVPFKNQFFSCSFKKKSQPFYTWLLFTKEMFQDINHSAYQPFCNAMCAVKDVCISLNKYSE